MTNVRRTHPALRSRVSAIALLTLAVTAGCAVQSEMTNLWSDPAVPASALHSVFVVGVRKNPVLRRRWEDAFVGALAARGVSATPSYRSFPDAVPDTDQVVDAVRRDGFDAVLTSSRLPNEATSRYVPGALHEEQVFPADNRGYRRFHSYWVTVQDPGYTETDTIIRLETDLWSTRGDGGHLVWSGTLRTLESVGGRTVDRAVNDEIMPQMEKQGAIPQALKRSR